MTTIAWDGCTLCADRLGDLNGLKAECIKIWKFADGRMFGGAGNYQDVLRVRDYLKDGENKPTVSDSFVGLVVTDNGKNVYRIESGLKEMPIIEKFHAIGSGRDFAIAAMACGKSSYQAVEIASRFDVNTGMDIDSILPYASAET